MDEMFSAGLSAPPASNVGGRGRLCNSVIQCLAGSILAKNMT